MWVGSHELNFKPHKLSRFFVNVFTAHVLGVVSEFELDSTIYC